MRKLIKCSDYVIEVEDYVHESKNYKRGFELIKNYANFLKQNLSERYQINGVLAHPLNRFIPCDLDGNVLSEPKNFHTYKLIKKNDSFLLGEESWKRSCQQYQEAKERVLFEGCVYDEEMEVVRYAVGKDLFYTGSCNYENKYITIEDLTNLDLTLTDNAVKQWEI